MNAFSLTSRTPVAEPLRDSTTEKAAEFQMLTLNELDFVGGGADIVNLG